MTKPLIEHDGKCRQCGMPQDELNSWKNVNTSTGLSIYCIECSRAKANKERLMRELSQILAGCWFNHVPDETDATDEAA